VKESDIQTNLQTHPDNLVRFVDKKKKLSRYRPGQALGVAGG
jgi:hypothetical protein